MHRDWCEAGFDPDAFWRQTYATIYTALAGYSERVKKAAILAGAKFNDAPALPDKKRQTPEEMAGIMRAWRSATRHFGEASA